jgi:hypothetical protein
MLSAMPSASLRAGITAVTRGQLGGAHVGGDHGSTSSRCRHSQKPPRAQIRYNQMARANAAIAVKTMPDRNQNSLRPGLVAQTGRILSHRCGKLGRNLFPKSSRNQSLRAVPAQP